VVDKVKGLELPAFDQMFRNGVRYRLGSGIEAAVEVQDAGTLNLATGRVTACDPFWGAQVERQVAPFTVTVPPGRYPVTVSLARGLLDGPDPAPLLGAAAKLTIRDEPVATWEVALPLGQDPARLQPDQIYTMALTAATRACLTRRLLAPLPLSTSQTRSWTGFSSRFGPRSGSISWWTRHLG
jgi:hypothetical protein